jgi:MFS family permease
MSDEPTIIQQPNPDKLSPAETRRALFVAAVAWGVFGSAWMNLISGAPFVSFAKKLGASTFEFGLLNALPFLGVLGQLAASYWVERHRRRKKLFLICGCLQRGSWLLAALLPWAIPESHPQLRVMALLGLLLFSSTMGNAGNAPWLSWFADYVPVRIRGRYLGQRAALATTTGLITAGLVGWVLDRDSSFAVFSIIFCLAAVLGLTDIIMFIWVRETRMIPHEGPPWQLRSVVMEPLRSAPFRRYLLYAFSEAFMFGVAGPFFWLLAKEDLMIGNFWSNFYIMMVPMIATALTFPLWGNACDKFGSRPLVAVGTFMTIVFPICWIIATPAHHHTVLAIAAIIGGGFGAAIGVADMNMLMSLTPQAGRSAFAAMVGVASALGWVLAPSLSGAFAEAMKDIHVSAAGLTFGNFDFLMLASLILRLLHVFFIVPKLPDTPKGTASGLVRYLVSWPMRRLGSLLSRSEM